MLEGDFGMEKIDDLYCIWKKQNGKIYWLNINKRFELYKGNRAGVKCFNHAINLMMKVCKT